MGLENKSREVARKLPAWLQKILRHGRRKYRKFINRPKVNFSTSHTKEAKSNFRFSANTDNILEELGAKYNPSKRTHNYLIYYWIHLRDIRNEVKTVVEIGVQTDRSIKMWEEFFPNATIYGLDIDENSKRFEGGRRRILIGDQSDPQFLRRVIDETCEEIDVIIDDGSHRVDHQLKSFSLLFPALTSHGIYIMEDTGGCVGDPELITVKELSTLINSIMYWPEGYEEADWPHLVEFTGNATWADKNVIGIAFYRWIVFVMRGKNPQDNPFLMKTPSLINGQTDVAEKD